MRSDIRYAFFTDFCASHLTATIAARHLAAVVLTLGVPLISQAATWAPQNAGCASNNFAELGCWLPGAGGMPRAGDNVIMNSPLPYTIYWDNDTLTGWQVQTGSGGTSPVTSNSLRVLNGKVMEMDAAHCINNGQKTPPEINRLAV